jgi:hypothetical protein
MAKRRRVGVWKRNLGRGGIGDMDAGIRMTPAAIDGRIAANHGRANHAKQRLMVF